ncbi:MAG: damage-control phosphatase ARMT1 family protein [Desulfobaccales bacterium]
MQPMRLRPECRDCLIRLVDLTVAMVTDDAALKDAARNAALDIIEREFAPGAIPALIASRFHQEIKRITGNPDPFSALKKAETASLKELFETLAPHFPADLESLLKLAVLGNSVDFFRSARQVAREATPTITFALSHLLVFQEMLADSPGQLLYLADNAGEQYFDAPLVQYLRGCGWQVFYVVKGGPIQNDLTRADLEASGLHGKLAPVLDTGAQTVGLVPADTSPAFQEAFAQARLIIAKGMGHFETLGDRPDPRIFYLLQAKCHPVAQALGVRRGDFIFAHANKVSLDK